MGLYRDYIVYWENLEYHLQNEQKLNCSLQRLHNFSGPPRHLATTPSQLSASLTGCSRMRLGKAIPEQTLPLTFVHLQVLTVEHGNILPFIIPDSLIPY